MKFKALGVLAIVAGMTLMPLTGRAQNAASTAGLMPSAARLTDIHNAPTVSEAVSAYARAVSDVRDPTTAQQAFIARVVELDQPTIAESQAREVTKFVNDGLAWGVIAYNEGRRENLDAAFDAAEKAIRVSPGNAFVARTAGELVAWYDTQVDPTKITPSIASHADILRRAAGNSRTYARAYDSTKQVLTEGASSSDDSLKIHIIGSFSDLAAYHDAGHSTGPLLVGFWQTPLLYPGYGYAYGAAPWWRGAAYAHGYAFPDVWVRNVDVNTRYMRLPGNNGFALIGPDGTTVVQTGGVLADGGYGYGNPYGYSYGYPYGYGAGGRYGYGLGWNSGLFGRNRQPGGIINTRSFGTFGQTRLSQRMSASFGFSAYDGPVLGGGQRSFSRGPGGRPSFQGIRP